MKEIIIDGTKIEISDESFNAFKEQFIKPKAFKPEINQKYFKVLSYGEIYTSTWDDKLSDFGPWELGNCFETREEVTEYRNWLIFHADAKRWFEVNPQDIDWTNRNCKYTIFYNHDDKMLDSYFSYSGQLAFYYFNSEENMYRFISDIGEARIKKYLFGVE